jgi:hypothetical protein
MFTKSKDTVLSVANAAELATAVVHKVIGNEVSNTINGSVVNRKSLSDIITMRIQSNFAKFSKAGVQ